MAGERISYLCMTMPHPLPMRMTPKGMLRNSPNHGPKSDHSFHSDGTNRAQLERWDCESRGKSQMIRDGTWERVATLVMITPWLLPNFVYEPKTPLNPIPSSVPKKKSIFPHFTSPPLPQKTGQWCAGKFTPQAVAQPRDFGTSGALCCRS